MRARCREVPRISHMAYYQQTQIDWDALKASVDAMFPVKSNPEPEPKPAVFCEKWTDYRGQVSEWLKEVPAPVSDTQIVSFVRVTKTMSFQGRRLHRSSLKTVPPGVDAHAFIQEFTDRCGGCAEGYNSHEEVVTKFVPSHRLKPGRSFI